MSRLVFGFAVLMLVASLIPACGGDGGGGGSAGAAPPAQAAPAEFKVYRSFPSATVTVPWPSTPPPPIRNLYFVPPVANTVLLRVEVTGIVNTPVGTAGALFSMVVFDNLGLQIGTATLNVPAGYRLYRMVCLVPQSSSYLNGFAPTFPDIAYRVHISVIPGSAASVPCTVNPTTVLFYVEEGVTEVVGLGITG